ncbi:YitT family protein [Neofamilia massiliensis]|uniref:YitT family protein n=1 Tax=Neofamilia massiliensis TaxID=1673724 RepID=UPI0006BB856A|nr:YitT family protein [Neofamilia massiliensis]
MKSSELFKSEDVKNLILPVTIGSALLALGQNFFSMPSGLISGGVSGLALMAEYSLGIKSGIAYFIMNIPMVLLALKKFNLRFTLYSFLSVIVFTIVQTLTAPYIHILQINDLMLNSIFSGVVRGIGAGMVYRVGSSTLGFDVIGAITRKAFNISVTSLNKLIDGVILISSAFIYGVEISLYTIVSQYILFTIADKIMLGIGERKNVMIVTRKHAEITEAIYQRLNRGVTLIHAEGAFSKEPIKMVFTVVSSRQIARIREIMAEIDEEAFLTITDSSEVKGNGFRDLG